MNKLAIGALCAAAATAMAIPAVAQGYYDQGSDYYYDPCRRDTTTRSTTGGLVGAGLGAVVGSNIAGRGVRTEGAVLGGLLGAAIGANVGRESAACSPGATRVPPPPPPPEASYGYGHYDRYGSGYGYEQPSYEYDAQPYQGANYGYDYDDRGYAYSVSEGSVAADGCTLAESPIYLPDGRVQKRFVRVCRDASGRYQVVD